MRKLILLIFFILAANFTFLSVGYGQTNINIHAVVPQTEFNSNTLLPQATQPTISENKYLYFFEKSLGLQKAKDNKSIVSNQPQTVYDKLASWVLMWAIVIIFAFIFLTILRLIDLFIFTRRKQ